MTARTTPNLQKIDDHVANRLRAARNMAGLTQEKACIPLGISFQQMQKYENGTNRVTSAKLAIMAKTYGVDLDWFFTDAPGLGGNKKTMVDWGIELTRLPDGPALAQAIVGLSRARRDLILAIALEMA